ncbi:hypothetical protein LTR94_037307, partial [Friedmanniomyces endolithicus]
ARRAVVHRPVGIRQIHHRQPGRGAVGRRGTPHLSDRRRQPASRPEPRSGLHRRGPGREHPSRRRSRQDDGRRRPDRP